LTVKGFVLSIPLAAAEAEKDRCERRSGEEDASFDGRMVTVMMMMGMTLMITLVSNAQHFSALSHPSCVLTLFRLSIPSRSLPSDNE
jgi:hypothetical protein